MKNLFILAFCLLVPGTGCQLMKPLQTPDSLDNATRRTWAVTANFASGLHHEYQQAPESFSDFGTMSRGPVPVLKNLTAVSGGGAEATYSLSAAEISALRRAVPGGLTLVLYDGGIACLSPGIKQTIEESLSKGGREEYFSVLRAQEGPALEWTRMALARR